MGGNINAWGNSGGITNDNILTGGSSNNFVNVAPGANGTVLTSNGTTASFQAAGGGGGAWTLLHTANASSSSSISFGSSYITSTYTNYVITINNLVPQNSSQLAMQWSTNNGSSWISSNYQSGTSDAKWSSLGTVASTDATSYILLEPFNMDNSGTITYNATLSLYNITNSSYPSCQGIYIAPAGGDMYTGVIVGNNSTSTALNAIQFYMVSGNITSGTFSLYGITQ